MAISLLYWKTDRALADLLRAQARADEQHQLVLEGRAKPGADPAQSEVDRRAGGGGGSASGRVTQSIVRDAQRAESDAEKRAAILEAVADLDAVSEVLSDDVESRATLAAAYRQLARIHGWWWQAGPDDASASLQALQRSVALGVRSPQRGSTI